MDRSIHRARFSRSASRFARRALFYALVAIGACAAHTGQLAHAAETAPPYTPDQIQHLDRFVGSDQARALLLRQGFVVTDQTFPQLFAAYVKQDDTPTLPNFVTVDSVWHAYHVLLTNGIEQLQQRRARMPEAKRTAAPETRALQRLGAESDPAAALFTETTAPRLPGRTLPSGLDLFAAGPLACDAGRRALRDTVDARQAAAIERAKATPWPDNLHHDALRLLAKLQQTPAGAPPQYHSAAWHDKQLGTALAAWSQLRHPSVQKPAASLDTDSHRLGPTAYIEPQPQFYAQLAELSRRAAQILSKDIAPPDLAAAGREWVAMAKLEKRRQRQWSAGTAAEALHLDQQATQDQPQRKQRAEAKYHELVGLRRRRWSREQEDALLDSARRCAENKDVTADDRQLMTAFASDALPEATALFPELAQFLDRLARIAQRQIDHQAIEPVDVQWLRDFGKELARFQIDDGRYGLNAYDNHARITPIFRQTLYAGVARPEAIYVIIHDGKRPVLHRGAVLSYRELKRSGDEPFGDEQWQQLVQQGQTPPPLACTRSFRISITPAEVAARIRAGQQYPNIESMTGQEIKQALLDVLASGKVEDASWQYEQLAPRVTVDDLDALLRLVENVHENDWYHLAECFGGIDWTSRRDTLVALLDHANPMASRTALGILSQNTSRIDLDALSRDFFKRSPRTRCHYLELIGISGEKSPARVQLLLTALKAPEPAVRLKAAEAAGKIGEGEPKLLSALTAGIKDENMFVASAMADALTARQAKEAGPIALERLTGKLPNRAEAEKHYALLADNLKFYASPETLATSLIRLLTAVKYEPAKAALWKMLSQDTPRSEESFLTSNAIAALLQFEPDEAARKALLLKILSDAKSRDDAIQSALSHIGTNDPSYIEPLLVLIDRPYLNASPAELYRPTVARTLADLAANLDRSEPAQEQLYNKVHRVLLARIKQPVPLQSLSALVQLDPAAACQAALRVAVDKKQPAAIRGNVLEFLNDWADLETVDALLPLLNEETPVPDHWHSMSIGDVAAEVLNRVFANSDAPGLAQHPSLKHAQTALSKLLPGPRGAKAVEVLSSLYGENRDGMLIKLVFDGKLPVATRVEGLQQLARYGSSDVVLKLLPLMTDKSKIAMDERSLGDTALSTMSQILERQRQVLDPDSDAWTPLRTSLEKELRGQRGPLAVEVLAPLDHDGRRDFLMRTAFDASLPIETRRAAVQCVSQTHSLALAVRLVPLLGDVAPPLPPAEDEDEPDEEDSLCADAAESIAAVFEDNEANTSDREEAIRLVRGPLEAMLRGPQGHVAVQAIASLEREQAAGFLLATASDRTLSPIVRGYALSQLSNARQPHLALHLVPLLDDTSGEEDELTIGEHAAIAIAALKGKEIEEISPEDTAAARAAFVKKARTWAVEP